MAIYTVHEPPPKRTETGRIRTRFVFVRDGFSFWAFLLAPLWMLRHRLWLVLVGYIVVAVALQIGAGADRCVGVGDGRRRLLLALLVGFEAATLRRWTLARRGWRNVGVVVGDDLELPSGASSTPGSTSPGRRRGCRPPPVARSRCRRRGSLQSLPTSSACFPEPGARAVTVAIVDYGSGNLHSAAKAFERAAREAGARRSRSSSPVIPMRCAAPTAWCCRASAPSRTAGAASMPSPAWSRRSTTACASAAGRSSASASACSSWPSAAASTR